MDGKGSSKLHWAPVDRTQLCNDVLNTSVMAALIGGFAFSNLQSLESPLRVDDPPPLDTAIYMFNVVAIHLCTCSCLTSAFLYKIINKLNDEIVLEWSQSMPWRFILPMPLSKFVVGCLFYLISVVLLSWRDLEFAGPSRQIAMAIGIGSVLMVCMTATLVVLKG
mmetsp:Transcript_85354/g.164339  ORF Transcript_85354/g.164339 Transcript_85354/m.164339 type:complete len:165 (-) Transcript_85354:1-495(-)